MSPAPPRQSRWLRPSLALFVALVLWALTWAVVFAGKACPCTEAGASPWWSSFSRCVSDMRGGLYGVLLLDGGTALAWGLVVLCGWLSATQGRRFAIVTVSGLLVASGVPGMPSFVSSGHERDPLGTLLTIALLFGFGLSLFMGGRVLRVACAWLVRHPLTSRRNP